MEPIQNGFLLSVGWDPASPRVPQWSRWAFAAGFGCKIFFLWENTVGNHKVPRALGFPACFGGAQGSRVIAAPQQDKGSVSRQPCTSGSAPW